MIRQFLLRRRLARYHRLAVGALQTARNIYWATGNVCLLAAAERYCRAEARVQKLLTTKNRNGGTKLSTRNSSGN